MSAPMPVVLVTVAGKRFALDAAEVVEVLPAVQYRPAGTGPKWLLGLFNLRGALLPLVDLSVIVDGQPTSIRMGTRIVVLRLEGDLFEGATRSVGLLVPEVAGLAVRDFRAPGAHDGFSFAGAPHLGPTVVDEDGTLQLLRCRRLLEGDAALRELPASSVDGGLG
jgi:chemotaxis-related protein WspB